MTAKIIYLGELRTEAIHLQSGEKIITDAPLDNNGKGEAFSPTDLLATSLGACMMTVMNIAARREGMDFVNSSVEINKTMSVDLPRRVTKIEVFIQMITPHELSKPQQEKFERIAHTCPVAHSLHPDIQQIIKFDWQV